jgi:hypothetical protein
MFGNKPAFALQDTTDRLTIAQLDSIDSARIQKQRYMDSLLEVYPIPYNKKGWDWDQFYDVLPKLIALALGLLIAIWRYDAKKRKAREEDNDREH